MNEQIALWPVALLFVAVFALVMLYYLICVAVCRRAEKREKREPPPHYNESIAGDRGW